MLLNNFSSTAFCTFFASFLQASSAFFASSTFFVFASEAFFNSFFVNFLWFLKKVSSTLAFTPSKDTFVEVFMT